MLRPCRCIPRAETYAREDVDPSRSTLADMVGQTARLVRPLIDDLARPVMSGERVHADDTVVPVLEPGRRCYRYSGS
jgi:transposase